MEIEIDINRYTALAHLLEVSLSSTTKLKNRQIGFFYIINFMRSKNIAKAIILSVTIF